MFASRRINQAFAQVEVRGLGDVGVGVMNLIETHTRAGGRALLTQLMPYRPHAIRLNASDLLLSAELDPLELSAVPSARSAVKLSFPVRSVRAAPAGAEVRLLNDPENKYVARRGEVFITRLPESSTVELAWKERSCTVRVMQPPRTAGRHHAGGAAAVPKVAR